MKSFISILSLADWVVFYLILLITVAAVIYGNKQKKDDNKEDINYLDLILMGRQLTLPLFVATLVATFYGGILGVTKITFEKGIFGFVTQGAFWYFTYIIFALFMAKKINESKANTLPDLIGKEFGQKSRKVSAILNLLNVIPISYAISVGLFLQILFGGTLIFNTAVGVTLVLLYSTKGGLRAVVYSDVIQFFVMVTSAFFIFIYSIKTYGGFSFLTTSLPESHLEPMGGQSVMKTLVWGVIALSTLVDPNFYQRCLAAKNFKVARNGILISTCIWFCFDIFMTGGALYAKASMPEIDSKTAYLEYALTLLPSGLRGFVLSGILATIISTLDSYIFLGATTIINDILGDRIKDKIKYHHIFAISIGVFSVIFSYLFSGNIEKVWKFFGSLSAACLLIPVLVGRLARHKIQDNEFFLASLSGAVSILSWKILSSFFDLPDIDELYIGSLSSLGVILGFTLFGKAYTNLKV